MRPLAHANAASSRRFGRRAPFTAAALAAPAPLASEMKLFAYTFVAGFLGVSMFIA